MKATFSRIKNTLFCPQFSPQNAENRILRLWNFKLFWVSTPPDPLPHPRKRGLMAPSWYSWILFSNLLTPSILLKPLLISSTGTQNLGIWNMLSSSWKTNTTTPSCFLCKKELWKLVGYLSEHFESSRIIKNPLTLLWQYYVSAKPVKGSCYHFKCMCDSNQITLMLFW